MRTFAVSLTAALTVSAGSLMSAAHAEGMDQSQWFAPSSTGGSCAFKKTEWASANTEDQSNSQSFVNLGSAGSITFTQATTGCVAGTFFANAGNESTGDHVELQVLLDGTPCSPLQGGYFFANSGDDFSSHSAGFFCGSTVAVGSHTIQVQYASQLGGTVAFFQRSLEVSHR